MSALVIVFGALTLLAGIVIVIRPAIIFEYLQRNSDKVGLHIAAVVVRLVLGIILI